MYFGPGTLAAGAKTRLESRIKKFMPHFICRYVQYRGQYSFPDTNTHCQYGTLAPYTPTHTASTVPWPPTHQHTLPVRCLVPLYTNTHCQYGALATVSNHIFCSIGSFSYQVGFSI